MAREDDRNRVPPVRRADGAHRSRAPDGSRLFRVRSGFPVGDRREGTPGRELERRSAEVEWKVERLPLAGEVLAELRGGVVEYLRRVLNQVDVGESGARRVVACPEDRPEPG